MSIARFLLLAIVGFAAAHSQAPWIWAGFAALGAFGALALTVSAPWLAPATRLTRCAESPRPGSRTK